MAVKYSMPHHLLTKLTCTNNLLGEREGSHIKYVDTYEALYLVCWMQCHQTNLLPNSSNLMTSYSTEPCLQMSVATYDEDQCQQ